MINNVVNIDSAKPEQWTIRVGKKSDNSICCFYKENCQCWTGLVEVDSMHKLPEALDRARCVMKSARAQGKRMEVAV